MQNLKRPAAKPAAISLKSLFRSSGKKHLIVTGAKKIGKSTLLRSAFSDVSCSITSTAVMTDAAHPDAIILNACGKSAVIGRYTVDHMEPIPAGFQIGIEAVEHFLESGAGMVYIDEIGFLESASDEYRQALIRLFDAVPVVASVRKQSSALIDALKSRGDVLVVDLDEWYNREIRIGCIVMASGFATRFGSNKLLAELEGKPIISYLMDKLGETDIAATVVVTRYPEVAEIADSYGYKGVLHTQPALSDTIRLGVEALPEMDGYMLSVADQPCLSGETIAALTEAFRYSPEHIIRIKCGDTPGNPVIFPARFKEELLSLTGENGGRTVIKAHPETLRYLYIDDPRELFDIDTVEALNDVQ